MKIEGWRARWLIAFGYWVLQIWVRTLRYKVEDRAGVVRKPVTANYIGSLWHNRLLIMPHILKKFTPARHGAALISASRDGELLTMAIHRFGFGVVRGSSSRMGASALLQLTEVLASGGDVVITPDGPLGPVYQLGPGLVFLAQKTGAPVLPMNIEYSSCWRIKNWDRFIIPRPFSRVRVTFGEPVQVAATKTDEEFEAERLRLQELMMSLVERR
ncbi:MAG TPA: lysophospholipid acyltransferase family protein [Chthoniobacterales bacterium]|nr:lysophospholipid acyltransferase family protein [Chthoniobacterales bacterium]